MLDSVRQPQPRKPDRFFSLVYISDSTSQLPKQAKYTCSKLDSVSGLVHCPAFAREDCSVTGPQSLAR
jgi:hypothetical protein